MLGTELSSESSEPVEIAYDSWDSSPSEIPVDEDEYESESPSSTEKSSNEPMLGEPCMRGVMENRLPPMV